MLKIGHITTLLQRGTQMLKIGHITTLLQRGMHTDVKNRSYYNLTSQRHTAVKK
jgi:hypothetical protein